MNIEIRPALPSDVTAIFHVRTAVTENALTMAELTKMGITAQSVTDMIAAGPCAWVAVGGDGVIGFAMIDAVEGALFAAFVLPSHEGRGIGRRLVELAERQLFERHPLCWLETGKATRAAGFYSRLGWSNQQDLGNGDIRLEKRRAPGQGLGR